MSSAYNFTFTTPENKSTTSFMYNKNDNWPNTSKQTKRKTLPGNNDSSDERNHTKSHQGIYIPQNENRNEAYSDQGRRQVKKCGVDTDGERGARAYNGVWGGAPSGVQEQSSWSGVRGRSPLD